MYYNYYNIYCIINSGMMKQVGVVTQYYYILCNLDMNELEKCVRSIETDGLIWKACKINCVCVC